MEQNKNLKLDLSVCQEHYSKKRLHEKWCWKFWLISNENKKIIPYEMK